MIGAGHNYFWHLWPNRTGHGQGLSFAPREGVPGFATNNGTMRLSRQMKLLYLERLRRLGLWQLADAEGVSWKTNGNFSANSDKHGQIEGRIVAAESERPKLIQYFVSKPVKIVFWLQYFYHPDAADKAPPYQIVRWDDYERPEVRITNILDHWEVGLDDRYVKGYLPSDFNAGAAPLLDFKAWSNGINYIIEPSGKMVQAQSVETSEHRSRIVLWSPWMWLLLVGLFMGTILSILWWRGLNRINKYTGSE